MQAVIVFFYVVLVGFIWRTIAMCLHDTSIGRAMAFLY